MNEWAAKEKVEVSIDYIPSQGNKNLLTTQPKPRRNPAMISSR